MDSIDTTASGTTNAGFGFRYSIRNSSGISWGATRKPNKEGLQQQENQAG